MTITAVAISMALLISMLAIAEGIWVDAVGDLEKSKEDILIIPSDVLGGTLNNGHELTEKINADHSNVSSAAPFLMDLLIANASTETVPDAGGMVIALGIIPEYFDEFLDKDKNLNIYGFEIKFNDWFEEEGDPHYENDFTGPYTYEVLVDKLLAENFGLEKGSELKLSKGFPSVSELVGTGDTSVLGTSQANNDKDLTFIVGGFFETSFEGGGFYGQFFQGNIILHLSELQSLKNLDVINIDNNTIIKDEINGISIALTKDVKEENRINEVADSLQLEYRYYKVLTKSDQLKRIEEQVSMARIYYTAIGSVAIIIGMLFVTCIMIITAIGSVAIIIGMLFVTCIMIISVYERTHEIGMLRAIGISRKTIFTQILTESVLIVFIGAVIGLIPGYFGSIALSDYLSSNLGVSQDFTAFTTDLIVNSFMVILVVGGIVSLYPAWRASHMKIVEALQHRH
jgi:ABC-type antimicrobial peptide transport system permease subunit